MYPGRPHKNTLMDTAQSTAAKRPRSSSFDTVPKPEEPAYKYVKKLPKSRRERRKLKGHTCRECEAYYAETNTVDLSSRHRQERSKTPPYFWEMEFPSREECLKRGYITLAEYNMGPPEKE